MVKECIRGSCEILERRGKLFEMSVMYYCAGGF